MRSNEKCKKCINRHAPIDQSSCWGCKDFSLFKDEDEIRRNRLKSCPLCGNSARVTEITQDAREIKTSIECSVCGLSLDWVQEFLIHERKDPITGEIKDVVRVAENMTAQDAWNRRI